MIYFPYFRGRQYDLLAFKDIAEQRCLPPNIIPIIEPVRDIRALPQTVAAFMAANHPLVIIANPTVSDYALTQQKLHDWHEWANDPNLIVGHILTPTTLPDDVTPSPDQPTLLIAHHYDELVAVQHAGWLETPTYLLVPPEARVRQLVSRSSISLFDHAWLPDHDQTYANLVDGFFSDDWVLADLLGYQGVSDYTIGGHYYSEHGYPAKAVTLHLTYFAGEQLRIHRFVSDDRTDFSHPKEKFFQAVAKLAAWLPQQPTAVQTPAAKQLAVYHEQQHFPGLGVVKRLSLVHHLQTMAAYFTQHYPA
ncbi:sce7725 family protein [Levilactobacillus brevis]|uniref:sce7725 family protein n=1 Tax=Levilactobacillus brevis TaxID=1580 RepID=UPI001BA63505|nr:sce7725 family protein [Levilactobacillus brevis]MBS1005378.1 sce7725 family protein [Levilactobacillus brevis]MBS1012648.1 sce7725 family protein [Levilactobacillus brevis]